MKAARRFFVSARLGSPGALGAGYGYGSTFASSSFSRRTRGERG
jgi:hypothetical protein